MELTDENDLSLDYCGETYNQLEWLLNKKNGNNMYVEEFIENMH